MQYLYKTLIIRPQAPEWALIVIYLFYCSHFMSLELLFTLILVYTEVLFDVSITIWIVWQYKKGFSFNQYSDAIVGVPLYFLYSFARTSAPSTFLNH